MKRALQREAMGAAMVAAALVFASAATTFADDLSPPPWRGDPYSTVQGWSFATNLNPAPSDLVSIQVTGDTDPNQTGPMATMSPELSWLPGPSGEGIWAADHNENGLIQFYLPNWLDFLPEKWLHVQVTYGYLGGPTVAPHGQTITGFDNVVGPNIVVVGFPSINDNGINFLTEDWVIQPNPDWEIYYLEVPMGSYVEQVVIDTISVPEPAAVGLFALAGLLCVRRSRP
jgi:hypothetical protein